MKTLAFLAVLFFLLAASISDAKTYSCKWLESDKHGENYFVQDTSFVFSIKENEIKIIQDDFLNRIYSPCWVGNFTSCSFSFSYDVNKAWEIFSKTNNSYTAYNSWYFTSELIFTFDEAGNLSLDGDDSDGTFINNEKFECN